MVATSSTIATRATGFERALDEAPGAVGLGLLPHQEAAQVAPAVAGGQGERGPDDRVGAQRQSAHGRDIGVVSEQVEDPEGDQARPLGRQRDLPAIHVVVGGPSARQGERTQPQSITLQQRDEALPVLGLPTRDHRFLPSQRLRSKSAARPGLTIRTHYQTLLSRPRLGSKRMSHVASRESSRKPFMLIDKIVQNDRIVETLRRQIMAYISVLGSNGMICLGIIEKKTSLLPSHEQWQSLQ